MTFSTTQPSIRARILPRFPANVLAGNGMVITKSGGTYIFATTGLVSSLDNLPPIPTDTILGRDATGTGPPAALVASGGLGFTGAGGITLTANQRTRPVWAIITGAPISTGVKSDIVVPFSCTITRSTLLADQSGSIVIDIWKNTYANYPPVVANSIVGATPPTLSSSFKAQDSALIGWTTTITAGDILRFNVNSATTVTRVLVQLDLVTV